MNALDTRRSAIVDSRHPLAEVQRLRVELDELRRLVAAIVAADPGPQVTVAEARRWAMDVARDAYQAGWDAGRLDLIADEKQVQVGIVRVLRELAPPAFRWHVCCGPCRRHGHRGGCKRCEDRTRETFSQPHPDDYPGAGR